MNKGNINIITYLIIISVILIGSSILTISGLANNVGLIKWVGGSSSLKNLKLYR